MKDYYSRRAQTYDQIYQRPERQEGLAAIESLLIDSCKGKKVLDLGCGPGFWTEKISKSAHAITGIDFSSEVLGLAAQRNYQCPTSFQELSFFNLKELDGQFEIVIGGFIASHILKSDMTRFLNGIEDVLVPGARILFFDNLYVEGNSTPIARKDEMGNSYQIRHLDDGSSFEVLKNFPSEAEWRHWLPDSSQWDYHTLEYFWALSYSAK